MKIKILEELWHIEHDSDSILLIQTAGPLNLTNTRPRFAAIKGQAARVDSFSDDKFHTKDGDSKKLTPTEAAAAPGNTTQQWTV